MFLGSNPQTTCSPSRAGYQEDKLKAMSCCSCPPESYGWDRILEQGSPNHGPGATSGWQTGLIWPAATHMFYICIYNFPH